MTTTTLQPNRVKYSDIARLEQRKIGGGLYRLISKITQSVVGMVRRSLADGWIVEVDGEQRAQGSHMTGLVRSFVESNVELFTGVDASRGSFEMVEVKSIDKCEIKLRDRNRRQNAWVARLDLPTQSDYNTDRAFVDAHAEGYDDDNIHYWSVSRLPAGVYELASWCNSRRITTYVTVDHIKGVQHLTDSKRDALAHVKKLTDDRIDALGGPLAALRYEVATTGQYTPIAAQCLRRARRDGVLSVALDCLPLDLLLAAVADPTLGRPQGAQGAAQGMRSLVAYNPNADADSPTTVAALIDATITLNLDDMPYAQWLQRNCVTVVRALLLRDDCATIWSDTRSAQGLDPTTLCDEIAERPGLMSELPDDIQAIFEDYPE